VTGSPGNPSLADILLRHANQRTQRDTLVYRRGDSVVCVVDGPTLMDRAQLAAGAIREAGVAPGDRVLLMLTSQAEFLDAFLGAVWADAIPVPLFPPLFSRRPEDFVANFARIAAGSGARLLIVSDDIAPAAQEFARRLERPPRLLDRTTWQACGARLADVPKRCGDDLALLQYTSGSTGAPKGVALSHGNLVANMSAIGRAVDLSEHDVGVSWLPLYHDMGLIGVLTTLYRGGRAVLMSPLEFARDPGTWLRAISQHGGTLSPAPNFAYERCLRLSDAAIADLDLATWRVAFNGAEPVRAETVHRFGDRFAAAGFRPEAFYPVYGLAEHTLAVSFPALGEGPCLDTVDRTSLAEARMAVPVPDGDGAACFVSVGSPLEGVEVEIRDEAGEALGDGQVGEITVHSGSVMSGYFGDPEATAEVLCNGWLRTGDLGYCRDGRLFVTGRIKDVIIRAGRNYYPDDIEIAVSGLVGIRTGRAAAFGVPGGQDGDDVVVAVEANLKCARARERLAGRISAAVSARVGFAPERIQFCDRDALPLTTSGKVRRSVARAKFLAGAL